MRMQNDNRGDDRGTGGATFIRYGSSFFNATRMSDMLEQERPKGGDLVVEGAFSFVNNGWRYSTAWFDACGDRLERVVERNFGRRFSSEDIMSLLLVLTSVIQSTLASTVWISVRAEFVMSGIISLFTLVNDRLNFNRKYSKLADLQLDFVRMIDKCPSKVDKITVRARSSEESLSLEDVQNMSDKYQENLEEVWNDFSHMDIYMKDGTHVTLHNLANYRNHYAKVQNMAIALSVSFVFANIAFNAAKMFYPAPDLAYGDLESDNNSFSAQMQINVSDISAPIPVVGNYTINRCTSNGTFTGEVAVEPNSFTNPDVQTAEKIVTILGGIPWRSIANWIITYMIQQQKGIKRITEDMAKLLAEEFRRQKELKKPTSRFPEEMINILFRMIETERVKEIIRTGIAVDDYNLAFFEKVAKAKGRAEATEKVQDLERAKQAISVLERQKSQRCVDLERAQADLSKQLMNLIAAQNLSEDRPDLAANLTAICDGVRSSQSETNLEEDEEEEGVVVPTNSSLLSSYNQVSTQDAEHHGPTPTSMLFSLPRHDTGASKFSLPRNDTGASRFSSLNRYDTDASQYSLQGLEPDLEGVDLPRNLAKGLTKLGPRRGKSNPSQMI